MDKVELKMKQTTTEHLLFESARRMYFFLMFFSVAVWNNQVFFGSILLQFLEWKNQNFTNIFFKTLFWFCEFLKIQFSPLKLLKPVVEKTPVLINMKQNFIEQKRGGAMLRRGNRRNIQHWRCIDVFLTSISFDRCFFLPILRCLIFMCFKVCYKLNKNHEAKNKKLKTREKERREKSKWNYISRIECILNRKTAREGGKSGEIVHTMGNRSLLLRQNHFAISLEV